MGVLRATVVAAQSVLAAVDATDPGYNTCVVDTLHYTISTAITSTAPRMPAAGAAVLWNSLRPPAIGVPLRGSRPHISGDRPHGEPVSRE